MPRRGLYHAKLKSGVIFDIIKGFYNINTLKSLCCRTFSLAMAKTIAD